jgi:hypothetical protein
MTSPTSGEVFTDAAIRRPTGGCTMFQKLRSFLSSVQPKDSPSTARKFTCRRTRLSLEELDARCVPATFWWNGATNGTWNTASNWWDTSLNSGNGGQAQRVPGGMGTTDTVVFRATDGSKAKTPAAPSTLTQERPLSRTSQSSRDIPPR